MIYDLWLTRGHKIHVLKPDVLNFCKPFKLFPW